MHIGLKNSIEDSSSCRDIQEQEEEQKFKLKKVGKKKRMKYTSLESLYKTFNSKYEV